MSVDLSSAQQSCKSKSFRLSAHLWRTRMISHFQQKGNRPLFFCFAPPPRLSALLTQWIPFFFRGKKAPIPQKTIKKFRGSNFSQLGSKNFGIFLLICVYNLGIALSTWLAGKRKVRSMRMLLGRKRRRRRRVRRQHLPRCKK